MVIQYTTADPPLTLRQFARLSAVIRAKLRGSNASC
jgi:hypothetical protein